MGFLCALSNLCDKFDKTPTPTESKSCSMIKEAALGGHLLLSGIRNAGIPDPFQAVIDIIVCAIPRMACN